MLSVGTDWELLLRTKELREVGENSPRGGIHCDELVLG